VLLALATSQNMSQLPSGERALLAALEERGFLATAEIWWSAQDWSRFDAMVVRSCWDYHLRVDEFRSWIGHLQQQNIG
jgi:hypothetical protein